MPDETLGRSRLIESEGPKNRITTGLLTPGPHVRASAARHFMTQLRRLMTDYTTVSMDGISTTLPVGRAQAYEWMGGRVRRLGSWDKYDKAVSHLLEKVPEERWAGLQVPGPRNSAQEALLEKWEQFHRRCVAGVIEPSPLPNRQHVVERVRGKVLSSPGLISTLRELYPQHTLVNLWGRDMPVAVFPAAPSVMSDLESARGELTDGVLPDDFEYSDDYDPAGLDAFERSVRRYESATTEERRTYFSGPTYALERIRLDKSGSPKLDCKLGRYFTAMATSEALDGELMVELARSPRATVNIRSLIQRSWLRDRVGDEVLDGRFRDSAVSHATVIMLATGNGGYDVILATRSKEVATHAEFSHVTPSGIFSPFSENPRSPKLEFSIRRNFYRELLEELYDRDENQREKLTEPTDPAAEPEIIRLSEMFAEGSAQVSYTGVSVNLLTLRPEICLMIKIDDPDWFRRESETRQANGRSLTLNWESVRDPAKIDRRDRSQPPHMILPLTSDLVPVSGRVLSPTYLVPNAAAAIQLAIRATAFTTKTPVSPDSVHVTTTPEVGAG